MAKRRKSSEITCVAGAGYDGLIGGISELLEHARRAAARSVNSILTAAYWEIGRLIVEHEQGGKERAEYGEALLQRLGRDLTARFGRGFSERNLLKMRTFYLGWEIVPTGSAQFEAHVRLSVEAGIAPEPFFQTPSGTPTAHPPPRQQPGAVERDIPPTVSAESGQIVSVRQIAQIPVGTLSDVFPLPWSQYVRLMSVSNPFARAFYESEALRGGWSVRQLDRQISTQFFERTAHSKQQATMLARGQKPKPQDAVSVQDEVRDPYLLEFLNLKDEYSENDLEEALIQHLEAFLLELGAGFTFVARQKRIRIGDEWYRFDLLLFHRRLKCLVVIDLKIGKFTHADAGQMSLYLTYAREHLREPGENEPVGLILCSEKDDAVVHYAMGGIQAKVFASRYLTALPDAETLRREILATKQALRTRAAMKGQHQD